MMFIKWKQRTSVRSVGLFALDEICENVGESGAVIEVIA